MRRLLCAVTVAVIALFSTSCSGSNGDSAASYCKTLKQARQDFKGFDFTSLSDAQFGKFRNRLQTIQDSAPASVKDDWRVLGSKLDQMKTLLAKGGVSFNDLQKLQHQQIPPGFDIAKFKAIVPQLQKLAGDNSISTARDAIARNAKATCHISITSNQHH